MTVTISADNLAGLLSLFGVFVGGLVCGGLYFGGLWWTVRKLTRSERPGLILFVSFLLRVALLLGAFYLLMAGRLERLVALLVGFLLARLVLRRRLAPGASRRARGGQTWS